MTGVIELAVVWIAEVDDAALLRASLCVGNVDATVTKLRGISSTDAIQRYEAVGQGPRLSIPL